MKVGFSTGCTLDITLKFAEWESIKPAFWMGLSKEYESSEGDIIPTLEEIKKEASEAQDECRRICEEKVDADIYNVKEVKVFEQIRYKDADRKKGGR